MTPGARGNAIRWGALAIGIVLFAAALYYINFSLAVSTIRRLGVALPLALLFSGVWHLVRTWAWAWCFPPGRKIPFLRLARVRLAAEAFSYLTLRGIAGEPLKVVLLSDRVDPREATAAVALERVAYMIGTTVIIGILSVIAITVLPLTRLWFRVFRGFAIGAAVIAILTGIVISGRGTYVRSFFARVDRRLGTSLGGGRVSQFIYAVERQMLDLVRSNPSRLAVLMSATVAAYASMALEAWVILRASGTPISTLDALTVETFSRVASFASAFIPANLGALEASSIAAVAVIGVSGGGAALALARRLRGLFWAGIGLAIYPRGTERRVNSSGEMTATSPSADPGDARERSVLLYIPRDASVPVSPDVRICGMPAGERIVRAALRAGYARILIWDPPRTGQSRLLEKLARELEGVRVIRSCDDWQEAVAGLEPQTVLTAVGAGTIASPTLFSHAALLTAESGAPVDVPAGPAWPVSGVIRLTATDAADPVTVGAALAARRADLSRPSGEDVSHGRGQLAIQMISPADIEPADRTLRRSSYKDTDVKIARFNRTISLPISIALIRTPLTANQLSVVLVAVGFYSGWLFSVGNYGAAVLAASLSLAASILDGCDGEIARLKYQESALGCWIETVGDYSYYLAVFIGIIVGVVRETGSVLFFRIGLLALAGTLLTFALLIYLRARITSGQPTRLHAIAKTRFKADPSLWTKLIWKALLRLHARRNALRDLRTRCSRPAAGSSSSSRRSARTCTG